MATRSITTIQSKSEKGKEYYANANIYRHYDGDVQGVDLFNFLNSLPKSFPNTYTGGAARLAAKLVVFMENLNVDPEILTEKQKFSNVEYYYTISLDENDFINIDIIQVEPISKGKKRIFNGTVDGYGDFLKKKKII